MSESQFNLQSNERELIKGALEASNGDTAQAAQTLGISERALQRKIKDLHLKSEAR